MSKRAWVACFAALAMMGAARGGEPVKAPVSSSASSGSCGGPETPIISTDCANVRGAEAAETQAWRLAQQVDLGREQFYGLVLSVVLAVFTTFFAWRASRWAKEAARAARNQSDTALRAYMAANRPRLRLRHINLTSFIAADQQVSVDIHLVNVGESVCVIKDVGVDFNVLEKGWRLSGNLEAPLRRILPVECGLGDTILLHEIKTFGKLGAIQVDAINARTSNLFCFGFVEYEEIAPVPEADRKTRRTAFIRRLDLPHSEVAGIGRFMPLDPPDPDYEFED